MDGVPQILDVSDDLRRAQDATDDDIGDAVRDIRDSLGASADRGQSIDEAELDEIDQSLLRLQERCGDEAGEYLQAARNRIQIFRKAVTGEGDSVSVIETRRETRDDESTFEVTVVNNTGEQVRGEAVVTFYDDAGSELDSAASAATTYEAGEERAVEVQTAPPDGASRYRASVELL
jgi:hypothetical protein